MTQKTMSEVEKVEGGAAHESGVLKDYLNELLQPFENSPLLYAVVVGASLLVLLWLFHLVFRFLVIRPLVSTRLLGDTHWLRKADLVQTKVLSSSSTLLSVATIGVLMRILPSFDSGFMELATRVVGAVGILVAARLVVRLGRLLDVVYSRLPSVNRVGALRGYVSVGGFLVYIAALVLIVSVLLDQSPVYFLTGLGALSAILLIVFRDTLLSMFANVIVTTGDLVRLGDWIHAPESNADGYVIDVSLNVVKVQNFDKTITVLPTYTLVQQSFVNYRGMYEAGGRRIKRALLLDQRTIRPITEVEIEALAGTPIMDRAIALERTAAGGAVQGDLPTNSGLFRQYALAYLEAHPRIHGAPFTLLVRHLAPTPGGLPLELYAFIDDTAWANYEAIQATIFDHLISVLPQFGLRLYQEESDFTEPGPESRMLRVGGATPEPPSDS